MSGGFFDYQQYRMTDMIESIESVIKNNGKAKTQKQLDESWYTPDWYEKYPEDLYHPKYSNEVIEKFKEGVILLKKAQVYAQRIDWLLSDDDGEESFLVRLKEDLEKL